MISKIDKPNKLNEKASCNHTYKSGKYVEHILDGKGGCTMKYYNAKRCIKCGNIKVGEEYDVETHKKCSHD